MFMLSRVASEYTGVGTRVIGHGVVIVVVVGGVGVAVV
jgi:hypothetical protein